MQAFNPTAPPRDVIEAGLVFEDLHQSLYRNLGGRADLEPGSQQLLVGGVGSGKTTELFLAVRWLREQGQALPLYIDISAETDLSSLNSGSLLASFGMYLALTVLSDLAANSELSQKKDKLKETYGKIAEYAYGKQVRRRVEPAQYFEAQYAVAGRVLGGQFVTETVPGKLKPPLPPLSRDTQEIRVPLHEFLSIARETHKDVVAVFDGLDRLLDPTKFWSVVHQDLRLLRELRIPVLATAPLSVLFGTGVGQSISDHFDRVYHLALIAEPDNASLRSVLEKRRGPELLAPPEADLICYSSGGVLRDLVSLARDAAEEAYVSDRDSVAIADIEKVARQLGTGYLRGLGPEAIKTLLDLERIKSFDVSRPANVQLLLTRRVLEYSSTDFRVHPALLSVIPRPEIKRA